MPAILNPVTYNDSARFRTETSTGPALVIFTTSWCPPCKAYQRELQGSQSFESFATRLPTLRTYLVDADESPEIARDYSVTQVPMTFALLDGKKKSARLRGVDGHSTLKDSIHGLPANISKQLIPFLEEAFGLPSSESTR